MTRASRSLVSLVVVLSCVAAATFVVRAAVSLSTSTPYAQPFDGMGIPASTTTASSLPADFRADALTSVRTVGNFATAGTTTARAGGPSLSSSAANGIYNFGAGSSGLGGSDRAVGFLASGSATTSGNLYLQLTNTTGSGLSGLNISYNVEKYRGGSNAAGFRIQLFYSTDGVSWTSAGSGFLTAFAADASNAGYATAPGTTVPVSNQLTAAIPNGSNFYLAWNYSVSTGSTVTNAQALAIDDIVVEGIGATGPTNPTATGSASPASVTAGGSALLSVNVTPGANPTSTGVSVTADLSSIGGSSSQAFADNGGNVFSFPATVSAGTAGGAKSIPFTVTDAEGRSVSGTIALTVTAASTAPSGLGSATPSHVPAGGTTQLAVNVVPGTNPPSTGLTVTGDLSSIGGSSAQPFQGTGTTFAFSAAVDASVSQGAKTLPILVSDAEGRSAALSIPVTVTAPLANSTIVISQIYPGGGNGSATYTNDYVQLYNRGNATVDLSGWSLQYAPATGTSDWTGRQPLGGTIGPGQYYLIALASGGAVGSALPPANVAGLINMGQSAGKVALVDTFDVLSGQCPSSPHVMDLVGYGTTANCWEGTGAAPAPTPVNVTALVRQDGGFTDTNDNKSDFVTGVPAPSTTAPIVQLPPQVLGTYPTVNGFNIPRDATIQVTFTEAVVLDPSWFAIVCDTTGPHSAAVEATDSNNNRYITPNTNFAAGESCTVTIAKSKVHDADTGALTPPADYSWSFTVASGAAPPESADVHLLMGNPTGATPEVEQPGNFLMSKPEFAMSYNRDMGRPNWVSWHLTDAWIPVNHPTRVDTFRPDPAVPSDWYRVQSFDFSGSGFDRGHMTPNADRESSVPDNQATFLMSNMVAQSPDNNQGPWAAFENYLRTVVHGDPNHLNELYVVSGPAGIGGTGSNGGVSTTVANGHVTVPAYTWKVALVLADNGSDDDIARVNCSTTTIAVIMPNVQGIRNTTWDTYLTTVNAVEATTGYHFFSALPQPIQNCIKAGTNGVNPKNDQTITLGPIADTTVGHDVSLQATASSGLAVTLEVTSGPATLVGGTTLHVTGVGTVTVRATQAGDVNYNAAPPVEQSFQVAPGTQTIAFGEPAPTPTYGASAFQVSATGGPSGNPVTFSAAGACTVVSQPGVATVSIVSAGACTITASQAASADYLAAPDVSETITIARATLDVTAHNASREYGAPEPAFDGVLTGAIPGDGITVSFSTPATSTSAPGPYPIKATLNDPNLRLGNYVVTSHDGVLTIVDTTPPVIDAHADVTAEATGPAGATVGYATPATHDAAGGDGEATCVPASGTTFGFGATTVTCSASDASGNHAADTTFTVTVRDTTPPTIDAHASLTVPAAGPGGSAVAYVPPASHDAVDGVGSASCVPASGSTFAIGGHTVVCAATDAHGNAATPVTFTINVTNTAPIFAPPANITREAAGPSGAVVTFTATGTDAEDGTITASCAPASGSTFPIGRTTVTCTVTDVAGATATGAFSVTVADTTPPTIEAHANVTVTAANARGAVVRYTAPATLDAVSGAGVANCTPASGSLFPIGTSTVTCSATDAAGNRAANTTFTVMVMPKHVNPPTVTAPRDRRVEATGPHGAVVTFTATAVDPVDGVIPVVCLPASGSQFPLGATIVTCSATNSFGKSDSDTAVITVSDTTAPDIESLTPSARVLPNTNTVVPLSIAVDVTDVVDPLPACRITSVFGGPRDLDNDGIVDWKITGPLTLNVDAVTRRHQERTYTITVMCSDASGNRSLGRTVVVVSKPTKGWGFPGF
jgi:DNA/RNA endonuclease G (NUC1)